MNLEKSWRVKIKLIKFPCKPHNTLAQLEGCVSSSILKKGSRAMFLNTDSYSGCLLDHAPTNKTRIAYQQLRYKLALKYGSDSRTSEVSPIDVACLSDDEIIRVQRICARLRSQT